MIMGLSGIALDRAIAHAAVPRIPIERHHSHLRGSRLVPTGPSLEDGSYGASFGSLGLGAFCALEEEERVYRLSRGC